MCDPITASIALAAAGSVAQAAGVRKAQKAQAGAQEAERIRQKRYQSEADARASENLAATNKDATDKGMDKSKAEREAASAKAVSEVQAPLAPSGENLAGDQTANAVIDAETAKQASKGLGFALQQGSAKANLASLNDVMFQNAISNARANQDIGRIANFARGSADVLPIELEAAARRGQGLRTLGSLLSAGGQVVGMGAGAGWWDKAADGAAGAANAANTANTITTTTAAKPLTLDALSPSLNPMLRISDPSLELMKLRYGHLLKSVTPTTGSSALSSNTLLSPLGK